MKTRELRPMLEAVLPRMPGFVVHKRMLLRAPMNGMLRAIYIEASDDRFAFYPTTVVMPLCVPTNFLSLLFGHRLRHKTRGWSWSAEMPDLQADLADAIADQGLPYLAQADTIEGFVALATEFRENLHTPKKIAFALARAGQFDRAIAVIEDYPPNLVPQVAWVQAIIDDSKLLLETLIENPEEAMQQLEEWERFTVQKLGLEAFC